MKFGFHLPEMLDTLPVMLWGMGGILIVMLAICLVLTALYKIGKRGN